MMNYKSKLCFILFGMLIVSCNEQPKQKEQAKTYFKDSVCRCTQLVLDKPYNHFFHEDNPRDMAFTGICRDSFKNGGLKIEKHLKEGKNDGIYKKYYKDGTLRSWKKIDMNYVEEVKNYFPSGVLKYHAKYKAGKIKNVIYSAGRDSTLQD